jgi:hypothetical protein
MFVYVFQKDGNVKLIFRHCKKENNEENGGQNHFDSLTMHHENARPRAAIATNPAAPPNARPQGPKVSTQ